METGTRPYTNGAGTEYDRLREAYDQAFHELAEALKENSGVVLAAREYQQRRDALSEFLMTRTHGDEHAPAVARLAYVLWEQAGRPYGTAESDWYNAEALLATT